MKLLLAVIGSLIFTIPVLADACTGSVVGGEATQWPMNDGLEAIFLNRVSPISQTLTVRMTVDNGVDPVVTRYVEPHLTEGFFSFNNPEGPADFSIPFCGEVKVTLRADGMKNIENAASIYPAPFPEGYGGYTWELNPGAPNSCEFTVSQFGGYGCSFFLLGIQN
jgi:hypothetical protein